MRILVVEDDCRIASFVSRGLREEHYAVDVATDGEQALLLAHTNDYDLIVLDLLLPKRSGLEVLCALRAEEVNIPILILTAKDQPKEKVAGLDKGADDYLLKPFEFDELLARLRALLRREGNVTPAILRAGDLTVDALHHQVTRADRELVLTSREYGVLEFFLLHPNQLVTRTMLAEHVWEHDFDPLSNVINVTVARLRKKVDGSFSKKLLHTVRDRGYMLHTPDDGKWVPTGRARGTHFVVPRACSGSFVEGS